MEAIRQRAARRDLLPGQKLPSIRAFSRSMHVSTSTVVDAYERLAAEGIIQSRPGSGFYLAGQAQPLVLADIGPPVDREVDPLWVSRQSLEAGQATLKPGCGWLPPDWMPEAALRRGLRTLSRAEAATLSDYDTPLGLPPLRHLLARRMRERGIEVQPGQIILTDNGTQAIDLLCRLLVNPGDTVLVDDPCYFNFHALLRAHRARVVGVAYTPSGPDIAAFAQAVSAHRPSLYITNSGIHNPTGAVLSPVTAHRLLQIAEQAGMTIIEDDIFADLEQANAPRLAAFDGLNRVIHIGSFSKTLSASIRCGFIATRKEWVDALVDLKIATSFGSGRLSAELVYAVLRDGSYRKHMDALKIRLARARTETGRRLREIGIEPWLEPEAGLFLWCQLPTGMDAADLAREVLADGIVLAPGNAFSLSRSAAGFMRFNASQSADARIYETLAKAMRILERAAPLPETPRLPGTGSPRPAP